MVLGSPLFNSRRWLILAALFALLVGVYLFTYNGQIESGDTRSFFNATGSLVQYGDTLLDRTSWAFQPLPWMQLTAYPLLNIDIEPLQLILPAPLYGLALHLPGIGLVHAVWLFNVFVCAAVCCLLFLYVLALGYSERVALLAALALGITTIFWVYSRTFFREPLASFMILSAALLIERWRASRYRSIVLLILSVLAVVGALLTKEAAIFALPALVLIFLPSIRFLSPDRQHRLVGIGLILLMIAIIGFAVFSTLSNTLDFTPLYTQIGSLINRNAAYARTIHVALHSYLLSIGGSVWGTSPIILLALPGLWMLYRRRQYRYIGVLIAVAAAFIVGYARLREIHWFGGLSWPPRFLIPIVPFLMLGTLPILDRFLRRPLRSLLTTAIGLLFAYSLWVQLSGVTLPWGTYNAVLPPQANGLSEWSDGLNTVQYLRWVLLPGQWGRLPLDFAWVRLNIIWWPVVCLSLIVISALALWRNLNPLQATPVKSKSSRLVFALPIVALILCWLCLRAIYADKIYLGDNQSLHNIMPIIQAEGRPNDVLLLADNNYEPFFLNYAKFDFPRIVTLPDQPGEQPGPDQAATVTSVNPDALLVKSSIPLIHNLAHGRDRLWLLADTGPWMPWSIRPVERFLVTHYYPIRELSVDPPDPAVRLIEFGTVPAPDLAAFRSPDVLTDLLYGDSIHLLGFTLPSGLTYQLGTVLPISLYWQTDKPVAQNYTIAWFLVNADNAVVAHESDTQPAWGFASTSTWQPGVPLWDNRALRLPSDLPPGEYRLWVRLYQSDAPDNLLSVSGGETVESTIGVLPVQIEITNPAS